MAVTFRISTRLDPLLVALKRGESAIFVGANGSGKTRLAVEIESQLGEIAHRVGAHRSLSLNPDVPKISEQSALRGLRLGHIDEAVGVKNRAYQRWKSRPAVSLLNDFDFLLQALFAEQGNTALATHTAARAGTLGDAVVPTKFEKLKKIWELLLPSKSLLLGGDHVNVGGGALAYSAAEMSDGERSVFYMLGQALFAPVDALLLIDEPELHIHPSILGRLWDEIQAARDDCCFVFITHDLNFAAHRVAQKFVLKGYSDEPPLWDAEPVPKDTGFDETTATLILGSRHPVLFVEGTDTSLDIAIYRACFSDWMVIHCGSCEAVIHSVSSMRRNAAMTRVTCAGLVDADDYTEEEISKMTDLGVSVLPVSEVENLMLLPDVASTIATHEGYAHDLLLQQLAKLRDELFSVAESAIDSAVLLFCRRQIDRAFKKIDLTDSKTLDDLATKYAAATKTIDVAVLADSTRATLEKTLRDRDLRVLLKKFDGKGAFMAVAARHLQKTRKDDFEHWLIRVLATGKVAGLAQAIRQSLPEIVPR